MDVSNVGAANGYQYNPKTTGDLQEEVKNTPDSEKRDLGVIVEISKDSPEAQKISELIKQRIDGQQRGKSNPSMHRIINGNSANGMVSFYGASVTKEQSEKLQSVIMDLEQQGFVKAAPNADGSYQAGDEALGYTLEPGTYAQLGLKVSQLSYACKEMGLSDEVAEQITNAYGKQAEEKINKVNSMVEFAAKQVKVEREKFYAEHGTPNYKKGITPVATNTTGKDSVEVNKESNNDVYKMFANLDVSSKENFRSSFERALAGFRNYFVADPIENYNGTNKEQMQLDELSKRFQSFLEK
ncbi:MAG: hypothetical protein K2L07_02335 [Lachnospiraceae bacterium]|nr:hypothetical protein [Lachnospiraceae bacterium]